MITTLYYVILAYFVLGAIAFGLIGRNKDKQVQRELWTKYLTYLLLIHLLFGCMVFFPDYFIILASLIGLRGFYELTRLHWRHGHGVSLAVYVRASLVYSLLLIPFLLFSAMEQGALLFVFVVVMVFDAFSQISGQLMGGRKLVPSVSPGKTISGSAGGATLAIITAVMVRSLIDAPWPAALLISAIVVIFALLGDLLASFYKRQHQVKDYGNLLPGHGGFLDRFDAFIAAGAAMYLINSLIS